MMNNYIPDLLRLERPNEESYGPLPKWVQNWRKWRAKTRLEEGKAEPAYRPSVTDITTLFRQAYAPVGVQILRLIA